MYMRLFLARIPHLLQLFTAALAMPAPLLLAGEIQTDRDDETVVIVAGGDLGFGGVDQPIGAQGGYRHGRPIAWADIGKEIAPLLDGDINFANLETVVTDNARLTPADKRFRFQMHAAGARRSVEMGFNVFSTANNHSRDYGRLGCARPCAISRA